MPYRPNFPIPGVIDPPKQCLCIEIPNHPDWKRVIAGLLTELTYWYNWERKGDMSGAQCAAVWKQVFNSIDWSNMSCGCCGEFDVIFQWTVDFVLQQSTDGGETWEDVPEQDPRNSSPVYPPVPGEPSDDKKCIAATSITTLIREQVGNQITDDMSRYTLGQLIHDWVTTVIQTSNPFEALITIIVNQILALLVGGLEAALTDSAYDAMTCCFVDHMSDDISFTETQWEDVRECILSDVSGIAGIFLEHLVFLIGRVGLTNLARSQAAAEGDCSCEGCAALFFVPEGFGEELSRTDTSITVRASLGGGPAYYAAVTSGDKDVCCNVNWNNDFFLNYAYKACGSEDLIVNSGDPYSGLNCWYALKTEGGGFDVTFNFP